MPLRFQFFVYQNLISFLEVEIRKREHSFDSHIGGQFSRKKLAYFRRGCFRGRYISPNAPYSIRRRAFCSSKGPRHKQASSQGFVYDLCCPYYISLCVMMLSHIDKVTHNLIVGHFLRSILCLFTDSRKN